jgi:hypothetical protein
VRIYIYLVGVILMALVACGSEDKGNSEEIKCQSGSSPYYGCWTSPKCFLADAVPEDPEWRVFKLDFTLDHKIVQNVKSYNNSSCSGASFDEITDSFVLPSFEELNSEVLPSGLAGYRLRMDGIEDAYLLVSVTPSNQLCISNNLFYLLGFFRYTYPLTDDDVDFDNCFDAN